MVSWWRRWLKKVRWCTRAMWLFDWATRTSTCRFWMPRPNWPRSRTCCVTPRWLCNRTVWTTRPNRLSWIWTPIANSAPTIRTSACMPRSWLARRITSSRRRITSSLPRSARSLPSAWSRTLSIAPCRWTRWRTISRICVRTWYWCASVRISSRYVRLSMANWDCWMWS